MSFLIAHLFQGTMDEAVLRIHDSRLTVFLRLFLDDGCCLIASLQDLLLLGHVGNDTLNVLVHLQQLNGKITGGEAQTDIVVALQVFLNGFYTLFYIGTVIDMQVTNPVLTELAFIHLDNGLEQLINTSTALEHGRHHGESQQLSQLVRIQLVASVFHLIKHIQCPNNAQVHVDELRSEVQVALQVTGVDDVDDDIGGLLYNLFAYI